MEYLFKRWIVEADDIQMASVFLYTSLKANMQMQQASTC